MTFFGRSVVLLVKDKKITSSTSPTYNKLLKKKRPTKIFTTLYFISNWTIVFKGVVSQYVGL